MHGFEYLFSGCIYWVGLCGTKGPIIIYDQGVEELEGGTYFRSENQNPVNDFRGVLKFDNFKGGISFWPVSRVKSSTHP